MNETSNAIDQVEFVQGSRHAYDMGVCIQRMRGWAHSLRELKGTTPPVNFSQEFPFTAFDNNRNRFSKRRFIVNFVRSLRRLVVLRAVDPALIFEMDHICDDLADRSTDLEHDFRRNRSYRRFNTSLAQLEKVVPAIATKDFNVTWHDFIVAWGNVKFPAGTGPLEEIYKAGLANMPAIASRYKAKGVRNLIALCRQLQVVAGDQPFWLACRPAGAVLKAPPTSVHRWLWKLMHDKVIERIVEGSRGHAAEYRYLGD